LILYDMCSNKGNHMKLLSMAIIFTLTTSAFSQSTQNDGGIVGGYVDESKQSPELKEQIKKFREQGNAGTGYPGGIAGGAVSGGIAGGAVSGGIAGGAVSGGIAGGAVSGGIAGGAVSGGIAGGWMDSNLANCKKEDDGTKISCPDGVYIKSPSVVDSIRSENLKERSLKKPNKNKLENKSVSEQ
jgi:hypothetical protein